MDKPILPDGCRWTVLRAAPKRGWQPMWWCRCSCGREKEVMHFHLVHGRSLSCGCYRVEVHREVRQGLRPKKGWKWVEPKEQKHFWYGTELLTLKEIALKEGVRLLPLRNKVRIMGLSVEEAVRDCLERGLVLGKG